MENPEARYNADAMAFVMPGPGGAHNWQPMAFSPASGLVYIPAIEAGFPYFSDAQFVQRRKAFNSGVDFNAAAMPDIPEVQEEVLASVKGHLAAWDPVGQKEMWRVQHEGPWNGGLLATAGNLVVQGIANGEFSIYRADTGDRLWSTDAQTGIIATPMSYTAGGEQHIAIVVGWGGIMALAPGKIALKGDPQTNLSRVLAFKLNGTAALPQRPAEPERQLA
ncbi:MAG: PQQ-binding-like beta-propeller repeat protein, partial [Gammaproteobacteria bacterium]|nr:PQQ-binding-like beta-propeller repeat protein [Gammaproteobacteria bacterium]